MAQAQHGSAPDIAGKDVANPLSLLLSAGMLLGWLGQKHARDDLAKAQTVIEVALGDLIRKPETRTRDLGGPLGTMAFSAAFCGLIG